MEKNTEKKVTEIYNIDIVFKSGYVFNAWYNNMDVSKNNGKVTIVEYTIADDQPNNIKSIMHINVDNIDMIYIREVKKVERLK